MSRFFFFIYATIFFFTACQTAETPPTESGLNLAGYTEPTDLYQEAQFPFYHGIASGDPRENRVVIWTRVTPRTAEPKVNVIWEIAADAAFTNILRREDIQAMPINDYVVKVDVKGLEPDTKYYYRFWSNNVYSPVGQTHTLAAKGMDTLRLAVVAGADYENGNFQVYRQVAELNDIDAVIHLGDYIQSGASRGEGNRKHYPLQGAVTLEDYRLRHSNYHTDPDLQAMHQAHPVIAIWNDGEFATGAYTEGAIDHDEHTQNVWQFRKNMARRAYFDWLPIRMNADLRAYRSFQFGDLAQLVLLDTRMEGRTAATAINKDDFTSSDRSILGMYQQNWLTKKGANLSSVWNILATPNTLINNELNEQSNDLLLQQWSGFPAARQALLDVLLPMKRTVVLSSDLGVSGTFEHANNLVEYSTPSINQQAKIDQSDIATVLSNDASFSNKNGYLIIEFTKEEAKAKWHFVDGSVKL